MIIQMNTKIKFKKINFYDSEVDVVEFNEDKIPYDIALKNGRAELYSLFENCSNYIEAIELIESDRDVCSKKNGYHVNSDCTGNLYLEWIVIYGDNSSETIMWDIRHY